MRANVQLEDTPIGKALIELQEIKELLSADVTVCASMLKEDGSQFWRRTLVRSVFALIEGTVFRMKQLAFEVSTSEKVSLSRGEVALLLEEDYDLNDKGELITKSNYLQIAKNIRFAFKALAHAYGINYELKVDNSGWDSFKKALKVRDRLMHPKSTSDIVVANEDVFCLEQTVSWFVKGVSEIQAEMILSMKGKIESLKSSKT